MDNSVMSNVEIFGIAHHSPTGAFELMHRLDEVNPDVVLVEGPEDLTNMMKWMCDKEIRFPIALMSYTQTQPVRSVLYPFASYSPEIQVILWAHKNKKECAFMDLPTSVILAFDNNQVYEEDGQEPRFDVYEELEKVTGEKYEDYWDRNFETIAGTGQYQAAMKVLGNELRLLEQRDTYSFSRNLIREAYMKRVILSKIAEDKKVFCVCGAYHVNGLETNEPMTDEEVKKLPRSESNSTLMPYTYYRLSRLSGYGAGNKAPGYYEMLWQALNDNSLTENFTEKYLVAVADEHRKAGNIVSSAEVIDADLLAKALSNFRGNRIPSLIDMHDAAITAMGHGNENELIESFLRIEVKGDHIGHVPNGIGKTSVQEDFNNQLTLLRLDKYKTEVAEELTLDLREKNTVQDEGKALIDLKRSFFLCRLYVLGIHFAKPIQTAIDGSKQAKAWSERWSLQWSADVEIEIIESSLLGDSILSATSIKLKEMADAAQTIDEAARVFHLAFMCGIPQTSIYALNALSNIAVDGAAVHSIANTADVLSTIIKFGSVRKYDSSILVPLLEKLYLRYILTLEEACVCNDDGVGAVIASMNIMSNVQLSVDSLVERGETFVKLMSRISTRDDLHPKCSGYAMALLVERGEANETLLLNELSKRLSPGMPVDLGSAWFEGLASKNRYSLITRLAIWRCMSDYVEGLDEEVFKRAVVCLRRALCEFTGKEKADIAENLGEIWGINKQQAATAMVQTLSEEEQAAIAEQAKKMSDELDEFDFDDI